MEEETTSSRRLTRKERRALHNNRGGNSQQSKLNFELCSIQPLTPNQQKTFEAYHQDKNLMLHGVAGTGKSFIAIYLALKEIFDSNSEYKKLIIIRSAVSTRDIGFLPGSSKEKMKAYEAPYYAICTELFNRGDAYEYLKQKNIIEFLPTSYVRGCTLNNCIVILDELQNCTGHELDSVITRAGKNCKIVFCGDFRQSDLIHQNERKGLFDFMKIIRNIKSFSFIEFGIDDIVRSGLVKSYLIARDKLEQSGVLHSLF